jgi:hypothetical protein
MRLGFLLLTLCVSLGGCQRSAVSDALQQRLDRLDGDNRALAARVSALEGASHIAAQLPAHTYTLTTTWMAFNQPPSTSQATFLSERDCDAARQKTLEQAAGIKDNLDRQVTERGGLYNPGPPPQVSAVCAEK